MNYPTYPNSSDYETDDDFSNEEVTEYEQDEGWEHGVVDNPIDSYTGEEIAE